MFLTDDDILQAVADCLKTAVGSLPAYWTNISSQAHTAAYQEIEGRLIKRGYTIAQINQWDRGAEFERAISLFWALTNGGGLSGQYDDRFIKMFDRRKELDDILLSIGGVYVSPGESQPGTVNFGGPTGTREDLRDIHRLIRW